MNIMEALAERALHSAAEPEGITVRVLSDDAEVAAHLAPLVASTLFPDRLFGRVIHLEQDAIGYLVTVIDQGLRRPR
jgi:hypothetical protein